MAEVVGVGEEEAAARLRGGDGAVGFGAALVEVADQEVGAAGVAQFLDLLQKVGDGEGGVGGSAGA